MPRTSRSCDLEALCQSKAVSNVVTVEELVKCSGRRHAHAYYKLATRSYFRSRGSYSEME